jgi:uncharacterized protein (UPF0335 family)
MSKSDGIAGDQLRTIVERIENVEAEIKELTEARKEIYQEAKGNGFDVRTLRDVIRVRKQDQKERDEQETLLDLYLEAIKVVPKAAKMPKAA